MGALVATAPEDCGRTVVTPVGAVPVPVPVPAAVVVRVTMVVGVAVVAVVCLDVVGTGLLLAV
jgi:hypothetical protein